eukprot:1194837-Prorocentrum_minimum.AAC.10
MVLNGVEWCVQVPEGVAVDNASLPSHPSETLEIIFPGQNTPARGMTIAGNGRSDTIITPRE